MKNICAVFLVLLVTACMNMEKSKPVTYEIISEEEINANTLPSGTKVILGLANDVNQSILVERVSDEFIIADDGAEFLISNVISLTIVSWGNLTPYVDDKTVENNSKTKNDRVREFGVFFCLLALLYLQNC